MSDLKQRIINALDGQTEHSRDCHLSGEYLAGLVMPIIEAERAILWCCHVRGPDDVHAAPDYETALKWADMTNAINWRGLKGKVTPPASYDDCLLKAVPAPWPWSAEAHAKDLPNSLAAFASRAAFSSAQGSSP